MPNRPRRKQLDPSTPTSNRKRNKGAELADGKFRSLHDLHLMEATGTDLEKVTVKS